jgi:hypothetical protein
MEYINVAASIVLEVCVMRQPVGDQDAFRRTPVSRQGQISLNWDVPSWSEGKGEALCEWKAYPEESETNGRK